MSFLRFQVPQHQELHRLVMIGDDGNKIRDSYYDLSRRYNLHLTMPPDSTFERIDNLVIPFFGTMIGDNEYLDPIILSEDLSLKIHIRSFYYVKEISQWGEEQKAQQNRGGLYRINPIALSQAALFNVSPRIIDLIHSHDWKQYEERVNDMMKFRERSLEGLKKGGVIDPNYK